MLTSTCPEAHLLWQEQPHPEDLSEVPWGRFYSLQMYDWEERENLQGRLLLASYYSVSTIRPLIARLHNRWTDRIDPALSVNAWDYLHSCGAQHRSERVGRLVARRGGEETMSLMMQMLQQSQISKSQAADSTLDARVAHLEDKLEAQGKLLHELVTRLEKKFGDDLEMDEAASEA